MTLTLPFFREVPLPGVLQKTDPAQLLCRSPPHGQRRRASTGRSRARPILRQVQRLPLFCVAPEGGVAGIILNMRICAIFRSRAASAAKPAADVSPPRHRSPPAMPPSQRLPALITPRRRLPFPAMAPRRGRSGFHVPPLPQLPQFQSSAAGKKSQQPKPWQQAPAGRLRAKKKPRTGQGDITGND